MAVLVVANHTGTTLGGGAYKLTRRLGEGDFGVVYVAEQHHTGFEVAVKVLKHRVPQRVFWGEVQALGRVNHEHACRVLDAFVESDGTMWIAMPLLEGQTLYSWLKQHGPMPLGQVVQLVQRIAGALEKAHENLIVHRDLKPANVMVREHKGELIPTLLDFGIAKWIEDVGGSIAGSSDGARAYRAPELWRDPQGAGPASDVYSLGAVAYECLAGRHPFAGAVTREEWEHAHCSKPIVPIGDNPPGVFAALYQSLAKHAEERPTARAFADALHAAFVASLPEVLKVTSLRWNANERSPEYLTLSPKDIETAERMNIAEHDVVQAACLKAHKRKRQVHWLRWKLGVLASASALTIGTLAYRSQKNKEAADERIAAVTITSEVEQGRQLVLLGDSRRASTHLANAFQGGDHSWSTEWMFARASEPARAELARLPAINGRMWSVTISPGGQQIVTTDAGGAQVWDARTYKQVYVLPHADVVYDAAFTADGAHLITACGDGAVRIWTAADGKLVRELRDQSRHVKLVKLAVHGSWIAAMDYDGANAFVWNAKTGQVVHAIHSNNGTLWSIAFSASGRWFATNLGDELHVLDTVTWNELDTLPRAARSLAWDPTQDRLAVGSPSGDISIWGVNGRRALHLREIGSPADIVAFSPDGTRIGTADLDGTIRVWDAASGNQRAQIPRANRIRSLVFNSTSELIAAGAQDGSVAAFDAASGVPLVALDGAKDGVWSLRFDGHRLIAASWSGAAHIWDARSRHRTWVTDATADECGVLTSTAVDRRFVAVGCEGHVTRVWDTAERKLLASLPPMSTPDGDWTVVLPVTSEDGTRAAIARGNTAEIYELPGGRLLRTVIHAVPVSALAFGSGRDVLTGATDGTIQLTHDGQQSLALSASPAGIDAVGVLPDGRVVATDAARHLRVISSTGVEVLEAPTRITLLRPSTDGWLVTLPGATIPSLRGRADPAVLWDLRARGRLVAELRGNLGRVVTAGWTHAGALTVGADGTVRLWDTDGHLVRDYQVLRQHLLIDVTVSPDGRLLVAGGADGLVEFWDFQTGRELWSLRAHASQVVGLHFEGADLITRGFGGELAGWQFGPAGDIDRGIVRP